MNLHLRRFLVAAWLVIAYCTTAPAVAVSPIAPGDIVFDEFFNGWQKLDPATNQVTSLPWPYPSTTEHMAFDIDGAILFQVASSNAINRLHPVTGDVTPLNIPGVTFPGGFVVESNGNLLIANGLDVSRYNRSTQTTSTMTSDTFFAPKGIARGSDGRVFITEFYNDLWEVYPANGAKSDVTSFNLTIPDLIVVRSDGDLIVKNFSPSALYRINPNSGAATLFSSDLPSSVLGMALDASDNLWLTAGTGIYKYSSAGGARTLVVSGSPHAIAVVPNNWTPPPAPEPSTLLLLGIGAISLLGYRKAKLHR